MILNDPKSFTVDVKGEITGQQYNGLFKIKPLLSHREKLRRDELKRQLLGANPDSAGPDASRTAAIFSKIWVHLLESPSWWRESGNGQELLDESPVIDVIEQILKIEQELLDSVNKDGEKAKEELKEIQKTKTE